MSWEWPRVCPHCRELTWHVPKDCPTKAAKEAAREALDVFEKTYREKLARRPQEVEP